MDITQFKCPNCGGPLTYDPKTGKIICDYCRSKFFSEELEGKANASADNSNAKSEEDGAVIYNCPSCGAQIVTDSTTAATFCYYCHNPVVMSGRMSGAYKPDYVIPFEIDKEKATKIFEDWIGKKKYVPDSFYSKEQVETMTGVYFPYLMYTCNIAGDIDAIGTKVTVSVRGGYQYTDTGKYEVRREGNMEIKRVFRNALKKANKVLADGVLPFDIEKMKPFSMSYLSGFFAENRDINQEDIEGEVRQEVRDYAVDRLKDSVLEYQDVQITADNTKLVNEKWEYALMPVWTLTYNDKEKGKIYYFSVNGQSGKTIGELPIDNKKLVKTFLLIAIPILLICLAVFYFIL